MMRNLNNLIKKRKEKVAQYESSLTAIIEKQIDIVKGDQKRKGQNKPKPAIKPSSIGAPCLRKIYYDYNRVEPDFPFPLNAKKILILGDTIGELISELLRKAGVLIDYRNKGNGEIPKSRFGDGLDPEFPLKDPEFEISAKIDAVCVIHGKLVIGEFKSINANQFDKLTEPKDDHKLQAAIYGKLFGKALRRGDYAHIPELEGFDEIDEVRVFYWKKDNSDFKEFLMSKEEIEKNWQIVVAKSDKIRKHTKAGTLPETTWYFCDGCQFRKKCAANFTVPKEDEESLS